MNIFNTYNKQKIDIEFNYVNERINKLKTIVNDLESRIAKLEKKPSKKTTKKVK